MYELHEGFFLKVLFLEGDYGRFCDWCSEADLMIGIVRETCGTSGDWHREGDLGQIW